MDKPAARQKRDQRPQEQLQAPQGWAEAQESLAAASGLSILLVSGHQPPALAVSNNNSICQAFQSSEVHAHLCDPYCGEAFNRAVSAGETVSYRCHAGLHCSAVPLELGGRKLAVIGGRAFLTSADYRALAERIRDGDLQDLLSGDLFRNVIFAAQQDLDQLAARISQQSANFNVDAPAKEMRQPVTQQAAKEKKVEDAPAAVEVSKAKEIEVETKAVAVAPPEVDEFQASDELRQASTSAFQALAEKYEIESLALLLRGRSTLNAIFTTGRYRNQPIHLEIGPKDARLTLTAKGGTSLALREGIDGFKPLSALAGSSAENGRQNAELFPLVVGDEVKGALIIGDAALTEPKRKAIIKYCRDVAMPLEVLRLRHELERRSRFADQLQRFMDRLNTDEPRETYHSILRYSAELLHAERGSLLLFDETSNELEVKAAVGARAEVASEARMRLGDGVSGTVLETGRPLVVADLDAGGRVTPAPAERNYKTKSFISYPILLGGRKIGVLNVTDKTGGGSYDEIDLSLLEAIAPQMALALDRAEWREKAAQFQLMSITDPLTGLLNRRYLEERLTEELSRSRRQSYAMSFMMIDIDDFKLYNDRNGHQAGDLALEMTAQCLKSALRAADVASRYGGEEFCILLPQTTLEEACSIGERIRRRVERTRYPHGKSQPLGAVTVSIGVSAFSNAVQTAAEIIHEADRELYLAKSHGKNRVEPQSTSPEEQAADNGPESVA